MEVIKMPFTISPRDLVEGFIKPHVEPIADQLNTPPHIRWIMYNDMIHQIRWEMSDDIEDVLRVVVRTTKGWDLTLPRHTMLEIRKALEKVI